MKIQLRNRPSASWTALYEVSGEWVGDVVNSYALEIMRCINTHDELVETVKTLLHVIDSSNFSVLQIQSTDRDKELGRVTYSDVIASARDVLKQVEEK